MAAVEKLTALKVQRLVKPGRHGDGGGLWLQVRGPDQRSWIFRFALAGKAHWMGLGDLNDVTLAEARAKAREARNLVAEGIDPIGHRKARRAEALAAVSVTFRVCAERYLASREGTWGNAKHQYQWKATLELANKTLGDLPVAMIDTPHVMKVLEPIWRERTETASRLRGRIESVLDYAKARGSRTGENPARWKGHLANLLAAPSRLQRVQHHAALPWRDVGSFMEALTGQDGVAARALRFAVVTAARSGEVRGATWAEVDLAEAVWSIPGERMKGGRDHRVPLSGPALAVLRQMESLRARDTDLIFPGIKRGRPLSDMSLIAVLRRMGRGDVVVHGFRSTFRDWAGETTAYPREVVEMALAHRLGNAVEQAYARGDLFQKRARLMAAWSEFCANPAPAGGDVVPLHKMEAA